MNLVAAICVVMLELLSLMRSILTLFRHFRYSAGFILAGPQFFHDPDLT